MHHNLILSLLLTQLLVPLRILQCAVYPSIQWTPQNPLFDRNDSTLYFLPSSVVHIVCPNPSTVVRKVKDNTPKDKLYQNLWIVPQEVHRHCNTNYSQRSRLLLRCNTPLTLKYYTLVFRKYSAIPGGLVFTPGREYYLIGTSDGSSSSIDNKADGNCKHENMKLKVYVCKNNKDERCRPQATLSSLSISRETTTTTATTTTTMAAFNTTSAITPTSLHATNLTAHVRTEEKIMSLSSAALNSEPTSTVGTTLADYRKALIVNSSGDTVLARQAFPCEAVSQMNWYVIIPLITCLFVSLMWNVIFIYRLRVRQQCQDLKITKADVIGCREQSGIQSRIGKALSLCRRPSADITEL